MPNLLTTKKTSFLFSKTEGTLNKPHLCFSFTATWIARLFISSLKTTSAFYFANDQAHNELF